MVGLGLLAGIAYAAWRWWDSQRQSAINEWEPQPFPYPPTPKVEDDTPSPAAASSGNGSTADVTEEVPEV
jgi:hypothetical protein